VRNLADHQAQLGNRAPEWGALERAHLRWLHPHAPVKHGGHAGESGRIEHEFVGRAGAYLFHAVKGRHPRRDPDSGAGKLDHGLDSSSHKKAVPSTQYLVSSCEYRAQPLRFAEVSSAGVPPAVAKASCLRSGGQGVTKSEGQIYECAAARALRLSGYLPHNSLWRRIRSSARSITDSSSCAYFTSRPLASR